MKSKRWSLSLLLIPLLILAVSTAWADEKIIDITIDSDELIEIEEGEDGQVIIVTIDDDGNRKVEKLHLDNLDGEHRIKIHVDSKGDYAKILSLTSEGSGAFLGVTLSEVDDDVADDAGMRKPAGVLIATVHDDTAADEAGLEAGDIILRLDGDKMSASGELSEAIGDHEPGDEVKLVIFRDGKKKTVKATLGERDRGPGLYSQKGFHGLHALPDLQGLEGLSEGLNFDFRFPRHEKMLFHNFLGTSHGGPRLGVGIRRLDKDLASYFPGSREGWVLVTDIYEDSAAEAAGLKVGDVVLSFDGRKVEDNEDLQSAVTEAEATATLGMKVLRHGEKLDFSVTLPEHHAFSEADPEILIRKIDKLDKNHDALLEKRLEELEAKLEKLMEKLEQQ